MTRLHVIPLNDELMHGIGLSCWCHPMLQAEGGSQIAVHNAKDLREANERNGHVNPDKKWATVEEIISPPLYTPAQLVELRAATVKEVGEREFTCDTCAWASHCEFAFDGYNTDGDCLAGK